MSLTSNNTYLPALHSVPNPFVPDSSGAVSWIQIGDLHMLGDDRQNFRDLERIVTEINNAFTSSTSFVFLPGDNADDGGEESYANVRRALDRLRLPWFSIIGDHDVHEKSFDNYKRYMSDELTYTFRVGDVLFIALNAFETPKPDSFAVSDYQIRMLETGLSSPEAMKVVFIHCYPSELKIGASDVIQAMKCFPPDVVAMGHAHYNEIANDGRTIYTATRSTGQVEEGPVGFSVSNLDLNTKTFSWKFFPLGDHLRVMIVSPADRRLATTTSQEGSATMLVRARVWGANQVRSIHATYGDQVVELKWIEGSNVWEGSLPRSPNAGRFLVLATDVSGNEATDFIELGDPKSNFEPRDLDNVIEPWEEHGHLGTRLGPNKNGRKW